MFGEDKSNFDVEVFKEVNFKVLVGWVVFVMRSGDEKKI